MTKKSEVADYETFERTRKFMNVVYGYGITIRSEHQALTYLFKDKLLTGSEWVGELFSHKISTSK